MIANTEKSKQIIALGMEFFLKKVQPVHSPGKYKSI